jgi:hypothetical protein
MGSTEQDESAVRKAIEAMDDAEAAAVLTGDPQGPARLWANDLIVNAPNNQVMRFAQILDRMTHQTALQYSSFERHREATLVRRDCAVTMGYEIVVPTGNVPNAGKTVTRRYTNIYHLEEGGWRVIARQVTNAAVE